MNVRKQEKCVENVESSNNGIEIAFTTMVRRWLVKGKNGEWQLPLAMSKKKVDTKRLTQRGGALSRNRKPQHIKRSSKKAKTSGTSNEHHEEVSAHHIHNKLTKDFLERSKMRLLSCTRAQLKTKTHETSDVSPKVSQPVTKDLPSGTAGKYEGQLLRNRSSARSDVKEEHVTSPTQAKNTRKTQKCVLVLNNTVSSLDRTTKVDNGKRVTAPPTQKRERRIETPPSQANSNNKKTQAGSGNSNAKKKEEVESKPVKRAVSEQPKGSSADEKNNAKDCPLTSGRSSNAILVLCNGQRKCKIEGCYKAAYQRGLCPAHGGRNKCRTQGCTNYSYSQGLCRTHGGEKPHTNSETGRGTAEPSVGEPKTGTPVPMTSQRVHDNFSRDITTKTNSKSPACKTTKNRSKLQTNKKLSKSSTSDAWRSSDLPNLFRSASCKRTEEAAVSVRHESIQYITPAAREEKPTVTKRQKTTGSPTSKSNTNLCRVRGCRQRVTSEGFCQTHTKCKNCRREGCNNVVSKNVLSGLCYSHGGRKKCQTKGCTKNSHYQGLCSKRGGRPICREEGCSRAVYLRGLCSNHLREIQGQVPDPLHRSGPGRARVKKEEDGV